MASTFIWIVLLTILLSSCSSKSVRRKGPATQKYRSSISFKERQRLNAIERYRLLRLDARKNPGKYRYYRTLKYSNGKISKKLIGIKSKREMAEKRRVVGIEISQNIDWYCIKHHDDWKFGSVNKCKCWAQNKLEECEEKYGNDSYGENREIVYCLKKYLRD